MAEAKKKKKPKLTMKQLNFVDAKLAGKNGTEAAMIAYNTTPKVASVIATENLNKPSIQEALDMVYEKRGITLDRIVAPHDAALKANRVVSVEGDFYETEVPDHMTRMAASKTLAQWLGVGKGEIVSGGIHFHQHSGDKQKDYGF